MTKKVVAFLLCSLLATGTITLGSEYEENWGPDVGSSLPELSVKDTEGEDRSIEDLVGDKQGLLIFFVRTTNW